jgi:leucyl/phenylalanyl-tRNA--protein transferase
MLLRTDHFRLSHSLRKTLRRFLRTPGCELRLDHDTPRVMAHCAQTAREGQDGTWILPEMVQAYRRWHALGAVHSFETWIDGQLAGGLYGVCLGRMFFGESMFSHRTDASKIAVSGLVAFCRANGITLIDCQQRTRHLASLGAREIPREQFETGLPPRLREPPVREWSYDRSMWALLDPGTPVQEPGP